MSDQIQREARLHEIALIFLRSELKPKHDVVMSDEPIAVRCYNQAEAFIKEGENRIKKEKGGLPKGLHPCAHLGKYGDPCTQCAMEKYYREQEQGK